jgi:23S rRNA pseudouridine2605 synthase
MARRKGQNKRGAGPKRGKAGPEKPGRRADVKKPGKDRLQKVLASAGVDSRRNCEELILSGAVTVNGKVVDFLPAFADAGVDDIRVDGERIRQPERHYYLLNKPKGVLCTNADPRGRKRAVDLVDCDERIFCVGRLDADTTGLIILTNDNELTNKLTHPRFKIPKTYEVRLRGKVDGEDLEKIKKGVWLSEGKTGRAAVKILKRGKGETFVEIKISQGLNRQIRRMFAKVGYKVRGLKRTAIGDIELKGVPVGGAKKLTKAQVGYLKKATKAKSGSK